ncbi:Uncharacterized protein QTN25_004980 [Entamoeba marina]
MSRRIYAPLSGDSLNEPTSNPIPTPSTNAPIPNVPLQQNIVPPSYTEPVSSFPQHSKKKTPEQTSMPAPTIISSQPIAYDYNTPPPFPLQPFVAGPNNNSSPKLMRLSMHSPPTTAGLLQKIQIPFSVEISPFVNLYDNEAIAPIQHDPTTLKRCPRCGGYVNPFCTFTENGKYMKCNLCSHVSLVDDDYFSPLQTNGLREDIASRPELMYGTVDYILSGNDPSYIPNPITPRRYVVCLDVSSESLNRVFQSISVVLSSVLANSINTTAEIGFITYHSAIHYWALKDTPRLVKVTDLSAPITPISPAEFFIPIQTAAEKLPLLIESINKHIATQAVHGNCLYAAVSAAAEILNTNGNVLLFTTSAPSNGPGSILRKPSDISSNPQTQANFLMNSLAKTLSPKGIAVDLFIFGDKFSDNVTIGDLSLHTGGTLSYYPNFSSANHIKLQSDISKVINTTNNGTDVELRLRTSRGLSIGNYLTSALPVPDMIDTIRIGQLTNESSVIAELTYDESLDPRENIYFQSVVLFTDNKGNRHLKIFNTAHKVVDSAAEVFKKADLSVVFATLIRSTLKGSNPRNNEKLSLEILDKVANLLAGYRKQCSAQVKSSILLLPEALKLLPIYVLGAMKHPALMHFAQLTTLASSYGFPGASSDLKFADVYQIASSSSQTLLKRFYPTARKVTNHAMGIVETVESEEYKVRLSSKELSLNDVFVVSDGSVYQILVGSQISDELKMKLFGQTVQFGVDDLTSLFYQTVLGDQENQITKLIFWDAGMNFSQVYVEVNVLDEQRLTSFVEDKTARGLGYFDLLVYCHKKIQQKLN